MAASYSSSIDDNDDRVWYYGWSWRTFESGDKTYHETQTGGAQARLDFTGTRASIVVNFPPASMAPIEAWASLDDDEWDYITYTASTRGENGVVLWESRTVAPGNHALWFQYGSRRDSTLRPIRLDWFGYEASSPPSSSRPRPLPSPSPPVTGPIPSKDTPPVLNAPPTSVTTTAPTITSNQTESTVQPTTIDSANLTSTSTTTTGGAHTLDQTFTRDGAVIPTSTSRTNTTDPDLSQHHHPGRSIPKQKIALITTFAVLVPLAILLAWLYYRRRLRKRSQHAAMMMPVAFKSHRKTSSASTWSSFHNDPPESRGPTPGPSSRPLGGKLTTDLKDDLRVDTTIPSSPPPPFFEPALVPMDPPPAPMPVPLLPRPTTHFTMREHDRAYPSSPSKAPEDVAEKREGVVFDAFFNVAVPPSSSRSQTRMRMAGPELDDLEPAPRYGDVSGQDDNALGVDFLDAPESMYYLYA